MRSSIRPARWRSTTSWAWSTACLPRPRLRARSSRASRPDGSGSVDLQRLATGVTPYPHLYVLEQSKTERLLVDHLENLGGRVHWSHPLRRLSVTADGRVECTTGGADIDTVRARYCVGADGSSSIVRELIGIPFEGKTNDHTFYVTDATHVQGLPAKSINLRFGVRDFLLAFPMGNEADQRLLGVVRGSADAVTEASTKQTLRRVFGVTYRRIALVLDLSRAPSGRRPVPQRSCFPCGRCRSRPLAGRRTGNEHRAAGRAQPRMQGQRRPRRQRRRRAISIGTVPSADPSPRGSCRPPMRCSGSSHPTAQYRAPSGAPWCGISLRSRRPSSRGSYGHRGSSSTCRRHGSTTG